MRTGAGMGGWVRAGATGAVLLVCTMAAGLPAQMPSGGPAADALPAGDGAQVLRARCLSCHGADLITSQRLGETGWGREIDKMVRWGANLQEAERPALLAYLSRHFAPVPAAAQAAAGHEGETVFTRACLSCHGADLVDQQRLSPAGWTREVEKMMRWGAKVSDAEKTALVEYLAVRYPAP